MLEAHVAIEAPAEWRGIASRYDATLFLLDWHRSDRSCCRALVEIEVDPSQTSHLLEELRSSEVFAEEDLVEVGPGVLKGAVTTRACLGCCSTFGTGVFHLTGSMGADGSLVMVLIASDREAVRSAIASMEAHGHVVSLLRLSRVVEEEVLTPRQESMIQVAYERGYFDIPKGISLRDLASFFSVSISTASELLRKAEQKLMAQYFG